jgi:hypothetical protein
MLSGGPTTGDVPSGATMQPRYMGRIMNTYPVSEPEMKNISTLSGQVTTRFSFASLLFGLGASIWTNAVFYTEFTPAGVLAAKYLAPVLVVISGLLFIGGIWSIVSRKNAWEEIKKESRPVETVAASAELVAPAARPLF